MQTVQSKILVPKRTSLQLLQLQLSISHHTPVTCIDAESFGPQTGSKRPH